MPTLIGFLLRLFLLLAGLVVAAGVVLAGSVGLMLWGAHTAWRKLTGQAVTPFGFRIDPRGAFRAAGRAAPSRTPRADAIPSRSRGADVTDVEARPR